MNRSQLSRLWSSLGKRVRCANSIFWLSTAYCTILKQSSLTPQSIRKWRWSNVTAPCTTPVRHAPSHLTPRLYIQDAYGLRSPRNDEALQRQLSRTYAALTSVLLAIRSTGANKHSMNPADVHSCPPACAPPGMIPWRDSPLTKWLQPVLATAAVQVILATVSPNSDDVQDTMATLSYVSRLRTSSAAVPSAAAAPPAMDGSALMHAANSGKMITVSPAWSAHCHNSGVSSTLNPSNLKLTGSFGTGGAPRGSGAASRRPVTRPRSVQAFGKQCLPQRPQSIGAGWDRAQAFGKPRMHDPNNRSASSTPRGHIRSTGNSPAPLASAFSAPLDTSSAYPHSPAGAPHGSPFRLSHTTAGMYGGAGARMPHMNMHDQSDSVPSAMSALRVHTSVCSGGDNGHQHARTSPTLHHTTLQSIAGAPWSPMHDVYSHQQPGFHHADSAPFENGGGSAIAFNCKAHGDSEAPGGRSMSPGRHPDGTAATAATVLVQEEDSRRFGELQAALRKRGVGVREEALLSQLLENLQAARAEVRHIFWLSGIHDAVMGARLAEFPVPSFT